MAAIPPSPLGGDLNHTFTSTRFSVTFLGDFANSAAMLQGSAQVGNALDGEVSLSQKRGGLLLGWQQFPLFQPCLNASGAPEPSLLLRPSFCLLPVALQQHLQMIFRISRSWCFPALRAHLPKVPSVSIINLLALQSRAGAELLFPLQSSLISVGEEARRS